MELDNEIAESHFAAANLKFWYEWDFKDALSLYQKAIEINPNMAEAHAGYAHCLNAIGQHTKGFEHAVIAYNLDPFSLINDFYVGWAYLHAGHHEKALELGRRMIELEPDFYIGHTIAGNALMVQKKYEEAQAPLEMAVKLNYSFLTLAEVGILYGMTGNEAKAREILKEMEVLGKTQPLSNYDKGFVHTFIGEYDFAAMHFAKGIEKREGLMVVAKDYLLLLDKNRYVPKIAEVLEKVETFKRNY
jgi:adenylate cyclase